MTLAQRFEKLPNASLGGFPNKLTWEKEENKWKMHAKFFDCLLRWINYINKRKVHKHELGRYIGLWKLNVNMDFQTLNHNKLLSQGQTRHAPKLKFFWYLMIFFHQERCTLKILLWHSFKIYNI